ncbi:MAG: hypothetical protein AAFP20_22475 [Cyanobacteria bacterium J06614_10]
MLGTLNAIAHHPFPMVLSKNIDRLLEQASIATENALRVETIRTALQGFGYTQTRLQTGRELCQALRTAQIQKNAAYGEQIGATAALNTAWDDARQHYMPLVQIARVAFKGDAATATELGLKGDRAKSLTRWLTQANQFYTNALASDTVLAGLGTFGITRKKLRTAQKSLQAVEAAAFAQEQAKGAAQRATQKRNAAVKALRSWLSDFIAIAKIALAQDVQQLESLGIKAAS